MKLPAPVTFFVAAILATAAAGVHAQSLTPNYVDVIRENSGSSGSWTTGTMSGTATDARVGLYFNSLVGGQSYNVTFQAMGAGFFDVMDGSGGSVGLDLNAIGGSTAASNPIDDDLPNTFELASQGWASWMQSDEVFRVDSLQPKSYGFSFIAPTSGQAVVWFKPFGAGVTNTQANGTFNVSNLQVTAVPEPETYALMALGLGVVGVTARRKRVQQG